MFKSIEYHKYAFRGHVNVFNYPFKYFQNVCDRLGAFAVLYLSLYSSFVILPPQSVTIQSYNVSESSFHQILARNSSAQSGIHSSVLYASLIVG